MQKKSTGVVLNTQLILVFLCNMIMLVVSDFKGWGKGFGKYLKACATITVMHLTIIYGGLLHCLITVRDYNYLFAISTTVHLLEFGVALMIARFLMKEKHQPDPA